MVELPVDFSEFALSIDPAKSREYLLNPTHPKGGSKAAFFVRFGFTREDAGDLTDALVEQAWNATEITTEHHPRNYGVMVNLTGPILSPDGRDPTIVTVWRWIPEEVIKNEGRRVYVARFVTAIPKTDHIKLAK